MNGHGFIDKLPPPEIQLKCYNFYLYYFARFKTVLPITVDSLKVLNYTVKIKIPGYSNCLVRKNSLQC